MSSFGARARSSAQPIEVCVIGAGPRGLSVVERLCANAANNHRPLVVHLVDPFVGYGGRVWSTGQSRSLLMNTVASQVTMFTDDSVDCEGPVVPGPSLYEWAGTVALMDPFHSYPSAVRIEARELGPDSYPTRALYGHYLTWVLRRLCSTAPKTVEIRLHAQSAVTLDDDSDGGTDKQVVELTDGTTLTGLSAVVLAQGHIDMPLGQQEERLSLHAAVHGLHYQPPANPAEVDLTAIRAGQTVAVRGMGLNFFDYLALFTTDRGGRFQRTPDGGLVYRPSGKEPDIYAGSRRGVPYHARGENEKGVFGRHEPVFLTPAVISKLRARAARGASVTFMSDVWPLISREVELVYYTTLLRRRSDSAAKDFAALYLVTDHDDLPVLLEKFGIASNEMWNWERIARPHGDRHFASPEDFHEWLRQLLLRDLMQARKGNVSDPVKAALDVLRDLRNEIRLVVDHSGLAGSSYRDELLAWYTPLNAYLSIGPPASRVEEMIALIDAGILRVVGPGMQVDMGEDCFVVRSSSVNGAEVRVKVLVEARLPEVDIRSTADPLMTHLRQTGRATPYRIPDPSGAHETGGLAVTGRPYQVIDAEGRPHPRRFGYGVPTESVHWVTAAGIRPGVNSVILSDADAIARAVLTAADATIVRTATTQAARPA
ncbi:FAD/NAD(P)-binding protein [Lentzea sp. HUAS TT2]|uniref:FAD/NAD(P)-binding protein n=1 Tax=Lentzea sp. HUAS TT2 TaxID=3447454 RepID=UPI003F70D6F1